MKLGLTFYLLLLKMCLKYFGLHFFKMLYFLHPSMDCFNIWTAAFVNKPLKSAFDNVTLTLIFDLPLSKLNRKALKKSVCKPIRHFLFCIFTILLNKRFFHSWNQFFKQISVHTIKADFHQCEISYRCPIANIQCDRNSMPEMSFSAIACQYNFFSYYHEEKNLTNQRLYRISRARRVIENAFCLLRAR